MRKEKSRIEIQRPVGLVHRLLVFALPGSREDRVNRDLGGQRIQFSRARAFGQRFVEPSLEGKRQSELIVSKRVVWIECECMVKFALAARPIKFVEKPEYSERCVRL